VKAVYRSGSESIIIQLSRSRRRKPLSERFFGFIAFILWLLYLFMFTGALPILVNLLLDCNNLVNTAVLKLDGVRNETVEMSMDSSTVDAITGALRIIQFGNYLYMVIEVSRFITLFFILYYLYVGDLKFIVLTFIFFFILEDIGGGVIRFITSLGVDTIDSNLLELSQYGTLSSYYTAEYLAQYSNSFPLVQRVWNSENLVFAIITRRSRDNFLWMLSMTIYLIVMAFSLLALKEMREE